MKVNVVSMVLITQMFVSICIGATIEDKVRLVADRLVENQEMEGDSQGTWLFEEAFTGTIVAGLLRAYQITGDERYLESAELAGDYMLSWSADNGGTMYGEETFGFMQLSQLSSTPEDNKWRTAIVGFFELIRNRPEGTSATVEKYGGLEIDPSQAVFDLAHYVVAAYYVDAVDKTIWRDGLVSVLINVEDEYASYPVLGLGAAVWALSQTGPLTDEIIDPFSGSEFIWYEVSFDELPGLLVHQQIPIEDEFGGSFYWRFDHTDGDENRVRPVGGYVEDMVLGIKGLRAAMFHQEETSFVLQPLMQAQCVVIDHVVSNGIVTEHLWQGGLISNVYAGQLLQAIPIPGDVNGDDRIDIVDITALGEYWLSTDLDLSYVCDRLDFDQNGQINIIDFQVMAKNYGKNYVTP